tara:strand:- start:2385 stop:2573 length:189 start_codon:yes stop_codon:yes gene_type:complete
MTINIWHKRGRFQEIGYRENIQSIVKGKTDTNKLYTSGHPLGQAIEFDFAEESTEETRAQVQ